jgi:hypothetical protein
MIFRAAAELRRMSGLGSDLRGGSDNVGTTGDGAGESESISTSMAGAEQVLFEASLDGVGGETKFDADSGSVSVGAIAVSADVILL